MEKFFTSTMAPFLLVGVGFILGCNVIPEHLQRLAALVGMTGLMLGMTKQVILQYQRGKCAMHWMLNSLMLVAVCLRGLYLIRTGQYWLAIPDVYGVFIIGIIQFQLAGKFLKAPNEVESTDR